MIKNPAMKRVQPRQILAAAILAATSSLAAADPAHLQLYVDSNSKQVFTEPGPGRVKLGTFQAVESQPSTNAASLKMGKKGLEISSAKGDFKMSIGGRIHMDASTHTNDGLIEKSSGDPVEATSGSSIRRGRIALKGVLYKDYQFILETDFAGDNVSMKDAMVTYTGVKAYELTVGNQKHAVSMEIQESSNDIMFIERSLLSALTTPHFDRAMGINLKTKGDDWSLQGGIYGDAISSSGDGADEGGGWGVRGTIAPINEANKLIHLGASLGQRQANDNNKLSNSKTPRARYETTAISELYLTNTGSIDGFEDISFIGLEAAAMHGPFSIQSEYGQTSINRDVGRNLSFDAYYVQMAWTLTGEARRYKGSDGEFKGLKPGKVFDPDQGKWGAWELAIRLDELSLNDVDVVGGEQKRLTLNLNWYLNDNLRILMGYSRAYDVEDSPLMQIGGDEPDNVDVFMIRTQLAF